MVIHSCLCVLTCLCLLCVLQHAMLPATLDQYSRTALAGYTGFKPQSGPAAGAVLPAQGPTAETTQGFANQQVRTLMSVGHELAPDLWVAAMFLHLLDHKWGVSDSDAAGSPQHTLMTLLFWRCLLLPICCRVDCRCCYVAHRKLTTPTASTAEQGSCLSLLKEERASVTMVWLTRSLTLAQVAGPMAAG